MTAQALAPPRAEHRAAEPAGVGRRLPAPTLDAAIGRLWETIGHHRAATCPVCGGAMQPEYGAGARPLGGRCVDCDSRLT